MSHVPSGAAGRAAAELDQLLASAHDARGLANLADRLVALDLEHALAPEAIDAYLRRAAALGATFPRPASATRDHYEHLLAAHYSWMAGDFTARSDAERAWLAGQGVRSAARARAIDLGAGAGCHAVALARLGFRVSAIDFSPTLVAELVERAAGLDVTPIVGDLLELERHCPEPAEVIACMGDTLTHLSSLHDVRLLLGRARRRLVPGGTLVLSYRDLSVELTGAARFIPVRSDDQTIFTCFLEYLPGRVMVHDLVHVRGPSGWTTKASAYPKLRLAQADVERWLVEAGFEVRHASSDRGLVRLVAA